jgi:sigma-B regulation protein RsbU (phosphoserine phosphatase)
VPADEAKEGLLDYVQAAARQADFARKALGYSEAKAQRRVLDHQLETARAIISRFVPPPFMELPGAEVAVQYRPALWVGGDYCDVWQLPDGRLALAVGDVSGKGLPAAVVMTCLRSVARAILPSRDGLSEAAGRLSRHLAQHTPENMFVTLVLGLFDLTTGALEYVNAGHSAPLLIAPNQAPRPVGSPTNPPLGHIECEFRTDRQLLPPGSGIVIVTDGITEATSPQGEQFGERRLRDLLAGQKSTSSRAIVEAIARAADDFRKPLGQQDDATVLALIRR